MKSELYEEAEAFVRSLESQLTPVKVGSSYMMLPESTAKKVGEYFNRLVEAGEHKDLFHLWAHIQKNPNILFSVHEYVSHIMVELACQNDSQED